MPAIDEDRVMGTLVSVNVGMPADVQWRGKTVHTGIYKSPVAGPVMARRLNLDGDGQGDLNGHGGEQRAVMVYQTESYEHWKSHFGREDLEPGSFGENFTVDGMTDAEVCIGDRYRIGRAEFEVTQPRVTCFRVGMRLGESDMPNLLVAHHRPGFYFRVITEGMVRAGDAIVRTRRGFPREIAVSHDARQAICRVSRAARLGKSKNWLVGPFVDPTHWLRTTGRGECLPNGNRRPFRPIGTGLTLQGLGDRNGPVFHDVGEYWFDLYSTKAGSHETN